MEERQNYPLDFTIENENVEKAFDVLYRELGFRYPALFQELEHILSVRVFRRAGDRVEDGLRLI